MWLVSIAAQFFIYCNLILAQDDIVSKTMSFITMAILSEKHFHRPEWLKHLVTHQNNILW